MPGRGRLVLWVQDLVLQAGGIVNRSPRPLLERARALERRAFRRADRLVVCSPGFADYAHDLGVPEERTSVVLNWVDTDRIRPEPRAANGSTKFLYSGNLGYSQGFETLIEAADIAGDGVEVKLVGAGNAAHELEAAPLVPAEDFPRLLASADVHVVVQRRAAAGANLPSKIASYLASGRPIVASIDHRTPAADLLRASGGALLVEPENPRALAHAMCRLRDDAGLRSHLARRGRDFAERVLSRERSLLRLEEAFLS
jgi:colanic acid biosynthesis glycosyl transferase WcaI